MSFDNAEVRSVLKRASEIEEAAALRRTDIEILMEAAAQAGIPRAAIERALRERMVLPMQPLTVGQLVLARSADDRYYVAEVLQTSSEGHTVKFLRGGEHTVQLDDLRPCSFLPGERVVVNWPWWGPWTCTVLSYDTAERRITVTDGWGETRDFAIAEVWVAPRKARGSRRKRLWAALVGAAAAGAVIGSLLTSMLGG